MSDGERGSAGRPLAQVLRAAFAGGLRMAVIRERDWDALAWRGLLRELAPQRAGGLRILASRRLDLARALGLDGVQLGADAVPVAQARRWLGPSAWIGYSAHSADEAAGAAREGASFVTLSPVFATDSKPGAPAQGCDWLARSLRGVPVPVFALGGITAERAAEVLAAGAHGVACVSAIGAAPDPERSAREFCTVLASRTEETR
jgi:thiamine-phosphate pyrophosphorylase